VPEKPAQLMMAQLMMFSELVYFDENQDTAIAIPGSRRAYRFSDKRHKMSTDTSESVSRSTSSATLDDEKEEPSMCNSHCGFFNCKSRFPNACSLGKQE
jgi:hypothetical protein